MNRLLIILVSCSLPSSSLLCPHFLGFVTWNWLSSTLGSSCLIQASQVHSPLGTALPSLLYLSSFLCPAPPLLPLPPLPPPFSPSSSFLSALVKIAIAGIKHLDKKPSGGENGLFHLTFTSQSSLKEIRSLRAETEAEPITLC